jgi:galactose mutarotase-like enzyme
MTSISEDTLEGFRRVTLDNGAVRAQFLPELGGKMSSLVRLESGHEFLLQAQRPLRRPHYGARFADFHTSGFDDCIPTVSPCRYPDSGGLMLPDHGELWSIPWKAESESETLRLSARGRALPYCFEKTISLIDESVQIDYSVKNETGTKLRFLWSAHPLLAVEPGSRIILPDEIGELWIEYSHGDRLGSHGSTCTWPTSNTAHGSARLDCLLSSEARFADKLFAPRMRNGYCALHKPSSHEHLEFHFDPEQIPHLGLWICQGAWPNIEHGHYTVALEPCTGWPDSLAEAVAEGEACELAGFGKEQWTLTLRLAPASRLVML